MEPFFNAMRGYFAEKGEEEQLLLLITMKRPKPIKTGLESSRPVSIFVGAPSRANLGTG